MMRVLLLSLVAAFATAAPVSAECAWVLWTRVTPSDWSLINGYGTEEGCKSVIREQAARIDPK
jgi:hypothetical protein